VLLQKEDLGLAPVLLLVAGDQGGDLPGEHEAGVGVGHPQRRQLLVAEEFRQLGGAAAGVDVRRDDQRVQVDHVRFEQGVQVRLDRWPRPAREAIVAGVQEPRHDGVFPGDRVEPGQRPVPENGQDRLDPQPPPAALFVHILQGRTAGLDVHVPAVLGLDRGIAAAAQHEGRVLAREIRHPNQIRQRLIHRKAPHKTPTIH
jgi:hypothetical protein